MKYFPFIGSRQFSQEVRDVQGNPIAYVYNDLNGINVVSTSPRYYNDKPRMTKIVRDCIALNGLPTEFRIAPCVNAKKYDFAQRAKLCKVIVAEPSSEVMK